MAKGVISKPMPTYWYSMRDNKIDESDSDEVIKEKEFNTRIVASRKPYFMIYIYPKLKAEYESYLNEKYRQSDYNNAFIDECSNDELKLLNKYASSFKEDNMSEIIKSINKRDEIKELRSPVGTNDCVVNKMAWCFESELKKYLSEELSTIKEKTQFDYGILKSNIIYSKATYRNVELAYKEYLEKIAKIQKQSRLEKIDKNDTIMQQKVALDFCISEFRKACSNEDELCNVLIDLCYSTNKNRQLVWDVCGNVIIDNLLKRNKGVIHYPKLVTENGDFEYCGKQFKMIKKELV